MEVRASREKSVSGARLLGGTGSGAACGAVGAYGTVRASKTEEPGTSGEWPGSLPGGGSGAVGLGSSRAKVTMRPQ